MMTRSVLLTLLAITVPALFADTPAPPSPHVTTASVSSVYFKMMPRLSTDWSRAAGNLVVTSKFDRPLWNKPLKETR